MNVTTTHSGAAVVLQIDEPRLTYPSLADFASAATNHDGFRPPTAVPDRRATRRRAFVVARLSLGRAGFRRDLLHRLLLRRHDPLQ